VGVQVDYVYGRTLAKSGTPLLARVRNPVTGALLTQAALSSISVVVTDVTAGERTYEGSLTIASVVYDTLQVDAAWAMDSWALPGLDGHAGYNFKWTLPASAISYTPGAEAGQPRPRQYQADVRFTPVSGEPLIVSFRFRALPTYV
jgi:hypothetical protein